MKHGLRRRLVLSAASVVCVLLVGCGHTDDATVTARSGNEQVVVRLGSCGVVVVDGRRVHRAALTATNESDESLSIVVHTTWKDGSFTDPRTPGGRGVSLAGRRDGGDGQTAWTQSSAQEVDGPDRAEPCGKTVQSVRVEVVVDS